MKLIIKFSCKLIILITILLNNMVICYAQHFPNDGPHTSTPYVNTYIDAPQPAHMTDYKGRDEVKLKPGTVIPVNSLVYLDPSIQAPVTYNSNPNAGFETTLPELNKDLNVGTIPGQASVNLMGSASYTIPFDFPKGSGGVVPQISLTYNSGGGMGIAGLGWNLNGLFAITRGGKNMADDGFVQGISLSNNDCFMFNGARLFPIGDNGRDGTEYHTQHESFSTIISHASNTFDGPNWWEIITKDGTKIEIGNTQNSKLIFHQVVQIPNPAYLQWEEDHWYWPSSQNPHDEEIDQEINANVMWMVTKITDPNGNFVTFEYDNKNNTEIVLTKIIYAGNNTSNPVITPDCEVNFYYSLTAFPNKVNSSLKSINSTVILRKIETKVSNQIYNSYSFEYGQKHIWEFLISIQKSNRFGQKLNPTHFQYGNINNDTYGYLLKNNGGSYNNDFDANGKDFFFIDFDGDGLKDMVGITTIPVPSSFNIIKMYKNIGNFKFDEISQLVATGGDNDLTFNGNSYKTACTTLVSMPTVVDFNGDGKEDLFIETVFDYLNSNNDLRRNYNYQVLISNGTSFTVDNIFNYSLNPLLASFKALVGDVDGDGLSDITQLHAIFNGNNGSLRVKNVNHTNFHNLDIYNNPNYGNYFSGDYRITTAAIVPKNATGQTIINAIQKCHTGNSGITCNIVGFEYFNSNNTFYEMGASYTNVIDCDNPFANSYFGDFNGDGHIDSYIDAATNSDNINTNFGNYIIGNTASAGINSFNCDRRIFTADINGDGKTDFVEATNTGTSTAIFVHYSTGISFTGGATTTHVNSTAVMQNKVDFVDIDGDGNLDMIFTPVHTNQQWIYVVNFKTTLAQVAMLSVKNGLGKIDKFNYTKGHEIIAINSAASFPNTIIGFPSKIIKTIESSNGIGGLFKTEYAYENPIFNREGKGFLGYKKTLVKDRVNNLMQSSTSTLLAGTLSGSNSHYAFLLPEKSESFKININGVLIGSALSRAKTTYELTPLINYTETTYPYQPFSNTVVNVNRKTYLLKTKTTDQYDLLANTHNHTIITTNNQGNVTKTEIDINGLETSVTDIVYDPNHLVTWVPFLPSKVTKTKTKGVNSLVDVTDYSYNVKNKVETEKHHDAFSGNATDYTTTIEYDYFNTGSIKETKTTDSEGSYIKSFTYDVKNKQLLTEKNILGQATTYTYEPLGNNPLSVKGITNLTSYAEYDGWFRKTKETAPTGIETEIKIEWADPNELNGKYFGLVSSFESTVVYKTTTSITGMPPSIEYFDVLGRNIFNISEGFNEIICSHTDYNNKGQTWRNYEPYATTGGNKRYTENVYDDLGRALSSTVKGGSVDLTTSYAYSFTNGNSTITISNPDGSTSSSTTDASGRTIENTDKMGGKVEYNYYIDADNQTRIETKVYGTIVTKAFFDEGGNQTKLWDKQAGETDYEYYGSGQLKKQTDPSGNVSTFSYKPDGRIDYKTVVGNTYTYVYESGNNGKNKVKELQGPNGNLIKYTYNNLQQLVKQEEYYESVSYITQHVYDNYGRETKYTYPNGFAVNNFYDAKGYLTAVKDNGGTVIWQLDEMTKIDQLKKYTLGNNKSTTIVYDNNRMLNNVQTPGVEQLLDYTFVPETGNLLDRRRKINGTYDYTDYFTYDDMDRLVTHRFDNNITPNNGLPFLVNTTDYDDYGKITSKSDAGFIYNYNLSKFRLSNIENPQPAISPIEQNIDYNSFKRPELISEGDYELSYTYGPNMKRIKGVWKDNGQIYRTRFYASNFEINIDNVTGVSHEVCYISAPSGLAAMYVTETNNGVLSTSGTSGALFYTYTDHLGSIISVTNSSGTVIARQNFDAWGRRRNALDYDYLPSNTKTIHNGLASLNAANPNLPAWLFRGYTGHEMLDEFALINMNARLYDPVVGMMLSPDNYVSDATNTQDYHRYCYARNNPLKYTDPDGNEPVTMAIAATLGAVFGGVAGYKVGVARGATGLDLLAYTMAGAGIGAGAAVTGAWIGAAAAGGGMTAIAAAALGGAGGGAVSGAGFYTLGNAGTKNFSGEGLTSATLRGAGVGAAGGTTGTLIGGGLGAFAGGASGSIYNDLLNKRDVNWTNALLSGTVSLGVYSYGMYQSWKASGGNIGGDSYEFGSYYRMQGAMQRYETFGKSFEIGANIYKGNNGFNKFGRIRYGSIIGKPGVDNPFRVGRIGDIHFHSLRGVGYEYPGPRDYQQFISENHYSDYNYKVFGYDGNVYRIDLGSSRLIGPSLSNFTSCGYTPQCVESWGSFMSTNNYNTPVSTYYIKPFGSYIFNP